MGNFSKIETITYVLRAFSCTGAISCWWLCRFSLGGSIDLFYNLVGSTTLYYFSTLCSYSILHSALLPIFSNAYAIKAFSFYLLYSEVLFASLLAVSSVCTYSWFIPYHVIMLYPLVDYGPNWPPCKNLHHSHSRRLPILFNFEWFPVSF
jgi:hypothetical protein